jgi:hypothetical protein
MPTILEIATTFVAITCGGCGAVFALSETHQRQLRDTGKTFYCPNGCPRAYCESTVTRLEKELKEKQDALDRQKIRLSQAEADARCERNRAERLKRSRDATRGVVTRIKNRVKNGVCPCCNRTFADLQRHMANQHPEWEPLEADDETTSG